tara:strand:- start:460 stop:693 length:234 start_codon:yes stop_codon:yes gene_type:complete
MYLFFQDRVIELSDGNKKLLSAFEVSPYLSSFIIFFIILLTTISVLRSIEKRNEWRKIAKEDNIDSKISNIESKKID